MNKCELKMLFRIVTVYLGAAVIFAGCMPEMPVTSIITVEVDGVSTPVNKDLYGLTIEEINHAVDGGIYAELIQNRSFEDGMPPLNCPYDVARNMLTTPNGWSIPFMRPDSISGWRRLSSGTYLYPDNKELVNDKNRRSLLVSVSASPELGRGGVVAEGYKGISIRKGEKYDLSFFIKGATLSPRTIRVALEDSAASTVLSDIFSLSTSFEWKRLRHTFTANENLDNAVLTITADSSSVFWVDVVSLFPQKTWKNRVRGLRPDLMEMIAAVSPRFIRFPGGSFVEGYTAGTYPIWKETIGDISERKHFWNIWAYGTTNGMGYHEYLQMCEDLNAEPVYVINSGVTSQSRRPRYEDITAMDKLVQDALDAIAYANEPADSTLGAMRVKNGHPESFHLKYIEIGSENYGIEYSKRYDLFREAIKNIYPDITVISSSFTSKKNRGDWVDSHFYSSEEFFIANHDRYNAEKQARRSPAVFVGEFGSVNKSSSGTLSEAIGEACFLIGAESSPEIVKRLAYSPVLGNADFKNVRNPIISFNNHQAIGTPSYYLLQMFANHRGDDVLKTDVDTYRKPQVTFGRAAIDLFDNSYEIKDVKIDNRLIEDASVLSGGWKVDNGQLIPEPNRWNYALMGDPEEHDCEFSATIMRTKGNSSLQFHLRDNGLMGERRDYISMTIGSGISELYRQAGAVTDSLASPKPFAFESNRWYTVKMTCKDEQIRCYVDDSLVHEAVLSPLPSLVSVATLDRTTHTLLLKVVNTTQHAEKTELNINGASVKNEVEVLELKGLPNAHNTFSNPETVVPVKKQLSFSLSGPMVYSFPPNSITILRLAVNE